MSPVRMDRFESGIRLVIAFNEAFNRHDVPAMMEMMSEQVAFENTAPAPDGTLYKGRVAVSEYWQNFFTSSPHAHIIIDEIFGFGNRVVMLWRYNWEDSTGQPGHVRGVDIYRIVNNLITEKLSYVKG